MIKKDALHVSEKTNFIGCWKIDSSICQNLINFFNANEKDHVPGRTSDDFNESIKKSTDLTIYPKNLSGSDKAINMYLENLFECYKNYLNEWSFLKSFLKQVDIGPFNIQKYEEGGHFAKVHSERTSLENLHRIFAFMTYLNDDFEGGKTSFTHFDLDVKPLIGRTMIWPAEWTHAHKGQIVTNGSKYIITGWLNIPYLK